MKQILAALCLLLFSAALYGVSPPAATENPPAAAAYRLVSQTQEPEIIPEPGEIYGKVMENDGLTPISGATVVLYDLSAVLFNASDHTRKEHKTDPDGGYAFAGIPAGEYLVRISKPGFGTNQQTAVVFMKEKTEVNFILDSYKFDQYYTKTPSNAAEKRIGGSAGCYASL